MQKIEKLPVLASINILFLLKAVAHEKLLRLFCQKNYREVAPDGLGPKAGYTYTGSTGPYKSIAGIILENISKVFKTDWVSPASVAVYIHYPEKNVLTVSTQSISQPYSFCCAAIDSEGNVTGNNILAGYRRTKDKPLSGGYTHYMHKAPRLLIVSDCLEEMRESQYGYLIEEAISMAQETITVTPEAIHLQVRAIQHISENTFKVEALKEESKQSVSE